MSCPGLPGAGKDTWLRQQRAQLPVISLDGKASVEELRWRARRRSGEAAGGVVPRPLAVKRADGAALVVARPAGERLRACALADLGLAQG
jgi:hypothetical protein